MLSIEVQIRRIAEPGGGFVTGVQLLELGLNRKAIQHRVSRGLLIPAYHDVYAVGHMPTNPLDRAHGALLACGPRSALSHGSGASLWGIRRRWAEPFEISSGLDRRPSGIRVHHRPALLQTDITIHQSLRVTTPALTLLDNAPRLADKRRVRALNHLRLEHGLELDQLGELLERFPCHPGARLIRAMLATAPGEPTRSYFEDEWPPFASAWGLCGYVMNHVICGYRVDVLFLPDLLIVELDGWQTHGTPPSFEADREQDATILELAGIPTIRLTHKQFHAHPARQAARIHAVLAGRRARHAA